MQSGGRLTAALGAAEAEGGRGRCPFETPGGEGRRGGGGGLYTCVSMRRCGALEEPRGVRAGLMYRRIYRCCYILMYRYIHRSGYILMYRCDGHARKEHEGAVGVQCQMTTCAAFRPGTKPLKDCQMRASWPRVASDWNLSGLLARDEVEEHHIIYIYIYLCVCVCVCV